MFGVNSIQKIENRGFGVFVYSTNLLNTQHGVLMWRVGFPKPCTSCKGFSHTLELVSAAQSMYDVVYLHTQPK